jgi:hydroxymethylbilane synthase
VKRELRLGTRGSKLALIQASYIKGRIEALRPDIKVSLKVIRTKGDKILDVPLAKIGDKGLFTREIERELLDGNLDLAVHSMKDLPVELPEGLALGPVPEREDPSDALVSPRGYTHFTLPEGAVIGSSSLRRKAQLLKLRGDLEVRDLRGNLDSRLKKLEEGQYTAMILARAGMVRMGWAEMPYVTLPFSLFLPAVGQGALAVEVRADDGKVKSLLAPLDHRETRVSIFSERSFMRALEGGCQIPVGALARMQGGTLILEGLVADLEGRMLFRGRIEGKPDEAEEMGVRLACRLIDQGAGAILDEIRGRHRPS